MGKSVTFKNMFAAMKDVVNPQMVKMDIEHAALEAFVHFFYTGFVKEDVMSELADKLLRAADKYDIGLLHDLCQEKLMKSIHPDRVFEYFLLGNKCRADQLVHAIVGFVANNYADVSEIHGYDNFLKDDPTLVAKLCNGVVKRLKGKMGKVEHGHKAATPL